MSKVGIIGDMHFGVRGGDIDFLEFQMNWLYKTLKDMKARGINRVIQVGDMLDNRKMLDVRVGWYLTHRFLPMLDELNMVFDSLVGNHNIFYRESNEIHNLWFMQSHPRFRVIQENLEEEGLLMLGWVNKNNLAEQMSVVANSKAGVCLGHFEFTDFPMYKGVLASHGADVEPFKKFKKVVTGHYHTVSEIGNIIYVGSPYHLTWSDYPDGVERGWFELDTETGSISLHKNEETDSLFSIFHYDHEAKYEASDLKHLAGRIVRIVVKDKGDTRKYNKFLALLNEIKFIEYKIVDETIITDKPKETIDPQKMITNTLGVLTDYTVKLAETVQGADIDLTKNIAVDLYQRASS